VFRRTALAVTIAALVALAALAAAGTASAAPADAGVELTGGSGKAVVALDGAVLGSLDRGRITVVTRRGDPLVLVQGYEWIRSGEDGSTVYGGHDMRFRVFRGAWRVTLQGGGIDASAVGTGSIGLRGNGRYSIDGGAYRAWPDDYKVILLGDS